MNFSFENFVLKSFDDIKPYFDELLGRDVQTKEETFQRIADYDTLSAHIGEDANRRYIHNSCDTANEEYKSAYMYFINEISPKLQEISDSVNKKLVSLPGIHEIEATDEAYHIFLRGITQSLKMYREENISLSVALSETERQYGEITGVMMMEYEGKSLTLQQAAVYLESPDREIRKKFYENIWKRRLEDATRLDDLLTEQIRLRNQMAQNAGYESFVEYQRDAYNRFDYTQQDVFDFHTGVKEYVVPLVKKIYEEKKAKLRIDTLQPYDLSATETNLQSLKPFQTADELLTKGIATIATVNTQFGKNLEVMKEAGRFDLDSRQGKRPGGYMMPMSVTLYPFIFMNAAGVHRDVETFVHEAGHAMHSFCMKENKSITLQSFREYPMEIAEVASMSMELLTMSHWNIFYKNSDDLQRAQLEQIDQSLITLCWIAIIDLFQYGLYKNPDHTIEERDEKFASLLAEYQPWIDYTNYTDVSHKRWQAQLHIYEVPFYYIEYGIAQLGAFGIWKNYIANPTDALAKYTAALSLGYTKKLPILYETAGIPFNFSPARIKELMDFVAGERNKIV